MKLKGTLSKFPSADPLLSTESYESNRQGRGYRAAVVERGTSLSTL